VKHRRSKVMSKKIRVGDADADLLNRNCLVKMIVQTMDQRRESWTNSNTIILFPDLKKKKKLRTQM